MRDDAAAFFQDLQHRICAALEALEPAARFLVDPWTHPSGGGGESRVIEGGEVFEKGGVNFSRVELPRADMAPDLAASLPGDGDRLWAAGISLILHPRNPWVPTVHANFRRIEFGDAAWFGGGIDLTPYYPFTADTIAFHRTLKAACDAHDPALHPRLKAWCDRYFFLPHRDECRGVGGLFFDHLGPDADHTDADRFAFVRTLGDAFLPSYLPIVERRHARPFTERERDFQALRRGRYVEFNLLHDRGTAFGLKTRGRIESILVSMPPTARWTYNYRPEPGSAESLIFEAIKPRDWAALPMPADPDTLG